MGVKQCANMAICKCANWLAHDCRDAMIASPAENRKIGIDVKLGNNLEAQNPNFKF